MKTKKTKEAVSLIVLVLTIVIMIILAGVIVINLNNSGIIDRAKGAVSETNLKNMQELANVAWGEAYLAIKGEKTPELIKSTMLEKLKGKGVSEEELAKYTFTVTTGGVEVAVNIGNGEETPEEGGTVTPEPEEPQINVALNPSGTIPEGATYYVEAFSTGETNYFTGLGEVIDDCENNASEKLTSGDEFPETTTAGDVYTYGAYIYIYNADVDDCEFTPGTGDAEWCAMYLGTSDDLTILESINGHAVDSLDWAFADKDLSDLSELIIPSTIIYMNQTFLRCYSLEKAPVIPSNVKDMTETFDSCEKLSEVTINATPTEYDGCFGESGITETSQILGDCENKEELVATNE